MTSNPPDPARLAELLAAGPLIAFGEWLAVHIDGCTCRRIGYGTPHEPGCGEEPVLKVDSAEAAAQLARDWNLLLTALTAPPVGYEYAAQRQHPDGSWSIVGVGPTSRDSALGDYLDWRLDEPDGTFRVVRRPVATWSDYHPAPARGVTTSEGAREMSDEKRCPINHCNRPQGIGTWASIAMGRDRSGDQMIPVCEEHWQALRGVLPVEAAPAESRLPSRPRSVPPDVG